MPATSQIRKSETLLLPGEVRVPDPVLRSERFLGDAGIWYRLARNATATSCRDAANRRERLGHVGIPPWDELKSIAFATPSGLAIAHCRGDEQLSLAAVAEALGMPDVTAADETVLDRLGLGYGLINPFHSWEDDRLNVQHLFDIAMTRRLDVPGTMMTNAGDRTWAVEFYAEDLVRSLPGSISAPLTLRTAAEGRPPWASASPRPIGIITGNAPESGMALMQTTINTVRERLGRMNMGDVSVPPMQLVSVPEMGLSMELSERTEAVAAALCAAAEKLVVDGCRTIAVACNTTQYFRPQLDEICSRHGAEFVAMPEIVADWLAAQEASAVGLVGIRYVSDLGEWSAYREALEDFRVDVPSAHGMRRIEEIAYEVKARGATSKTLGRLQNLLRDVIDEEFGSEYVVLALTELSMLIDLPGQPKSKQRTTLLDPLKLYGEALAHRYLGLPYPADRRAS